MMFPANEDIRAETFRLLSLADIHEIERLAPAREHRFFAGALDASDLRLIQRIAFRRRGGMSGDLRDWAAIDAWADEIARQLTASPSMR